MKYSAKNIFDCFSAHLFKFSPCIFLLFLFLVFLIFYINSYYYITTTIIHQFRGYYYFLKLALKLGMGNIKVNNKKSHKNSFVMHRNYKKFYSNDEI